MKTSRILTILTAVASLLTPRFSTAMEFVLPNFAGESGKTAILEMAIENPDTPVINFQCDITLPVGVEPLTNDREAIVCSLAADRADGHNIECAKVAENTYRFLCYSGRNYPLLGSEGTVFSLPLLLDCEVGEYEINVSGCVLTYRADETFDQYLQPDFSATLTVMEPQPVEELPDFSLFCYPMEIQPSRQASLTVYLKNLIPIKAFSLGLRLPEGITLVADDSGEYIDYTDRIPNRFDIEATINFDGEVTIAGASTRSTVVEADAEGSPLITVTLEADDEATVGEYMLWLDNQRFTLADDTQVEGESYECPISILPPETSVEMITTDALHSEGFDLQGRPVDNNYRGIVITKGHKNL